MSGDRGATTVLSVIDGLECCLANIAAAERYYPSNKGLDINLSVAVFAAAAAITADQNQMNV